MSWEILKYKGTNSILLCHTDCFVPKEKQYCYVTMRRVCIQCSCEAPEDMIRKLHFLQKLNDF